MAISLVADFSKDVPETLASETSAIANIADVARQIGHATALLHAMEPGSVPPGSSVEEQVKAALREGTEVGELPEPYARYSASELSSRLQSVDARSNGEVPIHGDLKVADFSIDSRGRVRAINTQKALHLGDPIWDLASLQLDLAQTYGAGAVFEFFAGYGSEPDLLKLDSALGFIGIFRALNVD